MLKIELIILLIAVAVFILQNKIRYSTSDASQKIVYWTIMFFISLSYNTILFTSYGNWYDINTYLSLNTLLIFIAIVVGYLLIQLLSPFKYLKRFISLFKSNKTSNDDNDKDVIYSKETLLVRQLHFEIFLETICWIGFISLLALEGYMTFAGDLNTNHFIDSNFILVLCLIIMLSLPITLRQILYYLFNIRDITKTSPSSQELHLQEKLQKNNTKL